MKSLHHLFERIIIARFAGSSADIERHHQYLSSSDRGLSDQSPAKQKRCGKSGIGSENHRY